MIALLIALLFSSPSPIGQCDPRDGSRVHFDAEDRAEVRARIQAACTDPQVAGAPVYCEGFIDSVVMRESRGNSALRHRRAEGEDGLGSMGHSLKWQRDKWDGTDEDPMFCLPEVNFVVEHSIVWRAYTRYAASDWVDVQAIMSGHFSCDVFADGRTKRCYAAPTHRDMSIICKGMSRRGFDCRAKLKRSDLGRRMRGRDRRAFVTRLTEAWRVGHAPQTPQTPR